MESDTRALAAIIFLIGPVKLYRGIFMLWLFSRFSFYIAFKEVHSLWYCAYHLLELRNAYTLNAHAHQDTKQIHP